jgi:hypothetical protein
MMTDNYGHHSCEARLTHMTKEAYDAYNGRLEPREEEDCKQAVLLELLEQFEDFKTEWFRYCESCQRTAQAYRDAMDW